MLAVVVVDLGPLPSRHVTAWVGYAQEVVDSLAGGADLDGLVVSDDVLEAFEGYLAQWERKAKRSKTFRWTGEADPEFVQYLLNAFHHIAVRLYDEAESTGTTLGPEEGEPFYSMLVRSLLDGLAHESVSCAEFVAHLREFWPGLTPSTLH